MRKLTLIFSWLLWVNLLTGFGCPAQATSDEEIFRRIVQVAGVGEEIRMTPALQQPYAREASTGAQVVGSPARLVLDAQLREVCASFKGQQDHALAFVIGQQLAMYYLSKEIPFLPQQAQLKLDTQTADRLGIIYAYMAGFPMLEMVPRILTSIYQRYGKTTQDPLYQARVSYLQEIQMNLQKFFLTFETANLLVLVNENLGAKRCYEYILAEYQGREIYNNAGVNLFKILVEKLKLDGRKPDFMYPVTLEGKTRLTRGSQTPKGFERVDIRKTYTRATRYFQKAIKADPKYAPAYHNLACLQNLRHRWQEAQKNTQIAARLSQQLPRYRGLVRQVKTVQAIIQYYLAGKDTIRQAQVAQQLHQLKSQDTTDYVYLNWKVMQGDPMGEIPNLEEKVDGWETICGINLQGLEHHPINTDYKTGQTKRIQQAQLYIGPPHEANQGFRIYREKVKGCLAEKIVFAFAGRLFYFLRTLPGYTGTTNLGAFKIDQANWKAIAHKNCYGLPKSRYEGTLQDYKIYHGRQIIFQLDKAKPQKLKGWILYHEVK